jgi:hypothetical protein
VQGSAFAPSPAGALQSVSGAYKKKKYHSLFLFLLMRVSFLHIKQILQPVVIVHTFMFKNLFCRHPPVVACTTLLWKGK